MGWLSDVLDFEKFNGKKIFGGIAKDPSRLVTGVDPASTGFWNAITGEHKHALVDQMGGARGETYKEAKDSGINTGPGRAMQNLAHVIAATYAAGGLSGIGAGAAAGEGGGASGVVDTVGFNPAVDSQLASTQLGYTAADTAGAGLGGSAVAGGTVAADAPDVAGLAQLDSNAVATEGAAPGLTDSYGHVADNSMSQYGKNLQQGGKLMQQQAEQRQRELDQSRVNAEAPVLQNPYATSSRTKKTGATESASALVARAAQPGAQPVDANGAEMASIQALTKQLRAAKAHLAALEGKRNSK